MGGLRRQRYPFLDTGGIWPSHRKIETDGSVWSQDAPVGVRLKVQTASLSQVMLPAESLWEVDASPGIVSLLHEGGRFRLWYSVSPPDDGRRLICYAESDDGFGWQRPALGRVTFAGRTDNNILCAANEHPLGFIFRDPSATDDARYKAVAPKGRYFRDGRHDPNLDTAQARKLLADMDLGGVDREERRRRLTIHQALYGAVSADGLSWRNLDEPILDVGTSALDTHNLCVWDEASSRYVAYLRGHLDRRRLIRRAEGDTFQQLDPPRICLQCDPQDPLDDDVYNSCYNQYPNLPGRHLMFPSIYHRIASTVDVQLAVSRDGWNWQRPERRSIIERCLSGDEFGSLYASPHLVALDDVWQLPVQCNRRLHDFRARGNAYPPDGELRWASWQPDRLVALQGDSKGVVTLVERPFSGEPARLNYATEAGGWVRVELVEPPHTPPQPVAALPGYGLEESEVLDGDELHRELRWNGTADLSHLRGQELSLRLHVHRARVFCLEV
jgi:hypothetical protein